MRSIRYVLGGIPHSLNDYLDLYRKHPQKRPSSSSVELIEKRVNRVEASCESSFYAVYQMTFSNKTVQCEQVCASNWLLFYLSRESLIKRANKKLEEYNMELENLGVPVTGKEKKFGNDVDTQIYETDVIFGRSV